MNIKEKISVFKKELAGKNLSPEQQKVYNVFSKTKGHPASFSVTDKEGRIVRFKIYPDKDDCGVRHIYRHYAEPKEYVTANEIINICAVIRNGQRYKSAAYTVYKFTYKYSKNTIRVSLRLTKQGLLKSFYSDRK